MTTLSSVFGERVDRLERGLVRKIEGVEGRVEGVVGRVRDGRKGGRSNDGCRSCNEVGKLIQEMHAEMRRLDTENRLLKDKLKNMELRESQGSSTERVLTERTPAETSRERQGHREFIPYYKAVQATTLSTPPSQEYPLPVTPLKERTQIMQTSYGRSRVGTMEKASPKFVCLQPSESKAVQGGNYSESERVSSAVSNRENLVSRGVSATRRKILGESTRTRAEENDRDRDRDRERDRDRDRDTERHRDRERPTSQYRRLHYR